MLAYGFLRFLRRPLFANFSAPDGLFRVLQPVQDISIASETSVWWWTIFQFPGSTRQKLVTRWSKLTCRPANVAWPRSRGLDPGMPRSVPELLDMQPLQEA